MAKGDSVSSTTPQWYILARHWGWSTYTAGIVAGPFESYSQAMITRSELSSDEAYEYTLVDIRFPRLPSDEMALLQKERESRNA